MSLDVAHLQQWLGKTEQQQDNLTLFPMVALAASLDRSGSNFAKGSPLPALWHWMYFLTPAAQSQLAHDGHPEKGDFLPPVALPRRMWAGSRFEFSQPLTVGQDALRKSEIKSIDTKQGRSGELAFVCVRHEFSTAGALAFIEEHDIVYRDNPSSDAAPSATITAPASSEFHKEYNPDPVLLFRYSALTFNSHRIHYDRDYTTQTEGYPGLIVHGPLLATLLVELLHQKLPCFAMTKFEFKAIHPVFDIHAFTVCGQQSSEGQVNLWVKNHHDVLCMKATATSN